MEFKTGDKLRYKGGYSEYEFNGEYEIAHVESLPLGEVVYYIDNGVKEDMWYANELHEHFDVIDDPQPQVTKVTLTQDESKVIKKAQFIYGTQLDVIIRDRIAGTLPNEISLLDTIPLDTLIRALYIGYEMEQTAEEKVLEAWVNHDWNVPRHEKEHHDAYYSGFRKGMKFTLDAYGIKVKGINN